MRNILILAVALALLAGLYTGLAIAQGTVIPIFFVNNTGSDAAVIDLPFNMSSVTLVDQAFVDSDVLNTDVQQSGESIGYMPGTGRVQMLGCFDNSGADETVDCNDVGASDITLPATGSDVFEFAFDNQARHLWLNIGTTAVADWTCEWSFWDGSVYVALSGVIDDTDCFTVAGLEKVTWDFPAEGLWPESTLHAIAGYWVQVEVTLDNPANPPTTAPLGTQSWYETGRWWTLLSEINNGQQSQVDVHLGTASVTGSDTFLVLTTTNDGRVSGVGPTFPPPAASTSTTTFFAESTLGAGPTFGYTQALIRFDTSSIPDSASVTDGSITCQVGTAQSQETPAFNFSAEWYGWGPALSLSNYNGIFQDNAIAPIDITTIVDNSPNTWTLLNLYNVNKAGYTGIRMFVDEESTGFQSLVSMSSFGVGDGPCELTLNWETPKEFHWLFTHMDGDTLPDNAALEPGSSFEVTIAGYYNCGGVGSAIFEKGNRLSVLCGSTANMARIRQNGSLEAQFSVPTGYHVITLTQGGSGASDSLTVLLDGVVVQTFAAAVITDTADAWGFFQNNNIVLDYFQYEVNNAIVVTWQLRDIPDHLLVNHENPGTFDAIAKYPDTIDGFATTTGIPTGSGETPGVDTGPGDNIGSVGPIDDFASVPTPVPGSETPMQELISIGTSYDYQIYAAFWGILIMAAFGLAGFMFGFNVVVGLIAAAIGGFVAWKLHFLPMWVPLVFTIVPVPFWLLKDRMMR